MASKQIATGEEFQHTISSGVCLIDFNAPWCGPCRAQEPIIKKLAEDYSGRITVAEMNIDENQATAVRLGIQSIPTISVFKNGAEVERFVGLQTAQTLATAIENNL